MMLKIYAALIKGILLMVSLLQLTILRLHRCFKIFAALRTDMYTGYPRGEVFLQENTGNKKY